MKLLILSTIYPRGKSELPGNKVHGKFVRDLAKEWHKKGHEVHVLTPHSINTLSFEILDHIHVHRFHYFFQEPWETLTYNDGIPQNIRKTKNKLLVPFLFAAFFFKTLVHIQKYKIHVINAHWAVPTGFIGWCIKKLTGTVLVTTLYGAELFPVVRNKMKILKPFIRTVLSGSNVVAGISDETVKMAQTLCSRSDIHVVPDGIDLEYYHPSPVHRNIIEKYNCPGCKIIFYSGRMVERKGHRCLLEAMIHLKTRLLNVKLILGGNGPLFEELISYREKWALKEQVIMPGFVPEEEMVPLLQSADLFVLPSCIDAHGDTEGSATAALEAMACGTPAIISRIGGNINAVKDGYGAYYFEPNNAEELAVKIVEVLDHPEKARQMSIEAREYISSHFSWDKIVDRYQELLSLKQAVF